MKQKAVDIFLISLPAPEGKRKDHPIGEAVLQYVQQAYCIRYQKINQGGITDGKAEADANTQ